MDTTKHEAEVLDFQAFKSRKGTQGDRKVGLQQTFKVSSTDEGFVTPMNKPLSTEANRSNDKDLDLSTRIERIKSSINRINQLMAELKSMSPSADPKKR